MVDRAAERLDGWNGTDGLSEDLNHRFSTAIMNFNAELSGCRTGALVQVWMADLLRDGSMVLQTGGLPFSISGVGDLLALFRCVSCRYRFTTDTSKPHLMGVIGRVYSSGQPELCYDVQVYDRSVYLRATEAQRCSVHSTIVTPVYLTPAREMPAAVVEISHHDKDVKFPEIISRLSSCLESVQLYMADIDLNSTKIGLRNWPVDINSMEETVIKDDTEDLFMQQGEQAPVPMLWAHEDSKKDPLDAQGAQQHRSPLGIHVGAQGPSPDVSSLPAVRIPSRKEYVAKSASGPLSRPNMPSKRNYVCRSASGPLTRPSALQDSATTHLRSVPPGPGKAQGLGYTSPITKHRAQHPVCPRPASGVQDLLASDPQLSAGLNILNAATQKTSPPPLSTIDAPGQPEFLSSSSDLSDLSDGEDGNKEADSSSLGRLRSKRLDKDIKGGQSSLERTSSGQNTKNDNRLGGGAGKRLTFKELQACFGVGLKEAAAQLGICPTTLKRACRRNGISRWPSRQISKLSKAWHQMGYQGSPPSWLVHKAITGNLKCDNLAFSLNAGLHLGLMPTGAAQPIERLQHPSSWNVLNMPHHTGSAPVATGLSRDTDNVANGVSSSQPVPMSALPTDQAEFFDEMAGFLQDPTAAASFGWNNSGHAAAAGALHALNSAYEAPRVFRSGPIYGVQGLLSGSPDTAVHARATMDNRQGQGRDQIIPVLTAFDGIGDTFPGDGGLGNVLNRPSMENVAFSGMEATPTVSEMQIAGGLF